jgi:predicted amidohydrolase YtcJ
MRSWLDAGLHPAASTDAPVCATDPFANLAAMVTRQSRSGAVLGADQRLSVAEALHAYTACGAHTQFAEDRLGRLVPGYLADIAILSHDLFAAEAEAALGAVQCDMTVLGGQIVFDRDG